MMGCSTHSQFTGNYYRDRRYKLKLSVIQSEEKAHGNLSDSVEVYVHSSAPHLKINVYRLPGIAIYHIPKFVLAVS
ncbi:hypothetical protein WG66_004363 [Moniliophthora roreri]|nr:hypothetical protein WG66_004363 [Moniliophthora roreri]